MSDGLLSTVLSVFHVSDIYAMMRIHTRQSPQISHNIRTTERWGEWHWSYIYIYYNTKFLWKTLGPGIYRNGLWHLKFTKLIWGISNPGGCLKLHTSGCFCTVFVVKQLALPWLGVCAWSVSGVVWQLVCVKQHPHECQNPEFPSTIFHCSMMVYVTDINSEWF